MLIDQLASVVGVAEAAIHPEVGWIAGMKSTIIIITEYKIFTSLLISPVNCFCFNIFASFKLIFLFLKIMLFNVTNPILANIDIPIEEKTNNLEKEDEK